MFVTRMLQERSAELQGMKVPRRWTAEDGRKFAEGVCQLSEKSTQVFEQGEAWENTSDGMEGEDVAEAEAQEEAAERTM